MAQRRGRLSDLDGRRITELFGMLPIQTDVVLMPDNVWRLHNLAREHGLSAYDAAYLELAQRRGFELATLDAKLARAARKMGIRVVRL